MKQDRGSVRVNGPALRYVRKSRHVSLAVVAERAGVSAPFLHQVETGRRPGMTRSVFAAVADALDVDPRVLMSHPVETPVPATA